MRTICPFCFWRLIRFPDFFAEAREQLLPEFFDEITERTGGYCGRACYFPTACMTIEDSKPFGIPCQTLCTTA